MKLSVSLRLRVDICTLDDCLCGKTADARDTHLAFGRMARHHEDNDLVWRALCKANVPSVKQASDLVRDDGKRPDGSTLIPWLADKSMAWDVTVVNTLAESYIPISASPGGAAVQEVIKIGLLVSAILPHLPTSGSGDSWPYKHHHFFRS